MLARRLLVNSCELKVKDVRSAECPSVNLYRSHQILYKLLTNEESENYG